MADFFIKYSYVLFAFFISLIISTLAVRKGIPRLKKNASLDRPALLSDPGFWIGFFEHIIIFALVMNKEFSALAIIFGAKEIVRKDEIKENPAYYLLGTLINFGVALLMAGLITEILRIECLG